MLHIHCLDNQPWISIVEPNPFCQRVLNGVLTSPHFVCRIPPALSTGRAWSDFNLFLKLAVVAFQQPVKSQVFIQIRPVQAKRGNLDMVQLLVRASRQKGKSVQEIGRHRVRMPIPGNPFMIQRTHFLDGSFGFAHRLGVSL